MKLSSALLVFAIALLSIVVFTCSRSAEATAVAKTYIKADQCCLGCSYNSGSCCCGRHPAKPRTVTKRLTKTKLITRTATATGTAAKGRRHELADREADVIAEEPKLFDDNNEAVEISERPVSALFARHLCPTCPKGVTVLNKSKGKNNGGSGAIYCCPQPVTKTVSRIVKTLTKTVMKTVTAKKQFTVNGRLYVDTNGNNVYDAGIDTPYVNTPVSLLLLSVKKAARAAAAGTTLVTNVTNSQGLFFFTVPGSSVPNNSNLGIVETSKPDVVLKTFEAGPSGPTGGSGFVDAPVGGNAGETTTQLPVGATTTKAAVMVTTPVLPPGATTTKKQTTNPAGVTTVAPGATTAGAATTTVAGAITSTAVFPVTTAAGGVETSTSATTSAPTTSATPTTTVPAFAARWDFGYGTGASGNIYPQHMERDNEGNIYVAGYMSSPSAIVGGMSFSQSDTTTGSYDLFVVKMNFNLTAIWAKTYGGNDSSEGLQSMTLDPVSGDIYLASACGDSPSRTWITINGVTFPQCAGLVWKIDTNGNAVWGVATGNRSQTSSNSMKACAVHSSGLVCVGQLSYPGYTLGPYDFGPTVSTGHGACSVLMTLDPATGAVRNATSMCPGVGCGFRLSHVVATTTPGAPFFIGGNGYCNLTFGGVTTTSAPPNDDHPFIFSTNSDYSANWGHFLGRLTDPSTIEMVALQIKSDGTELVYSSILQAATLCGGETIDKLAWWNGIDAAYAARIDASNGDCLRGIAVSGSESDGTTFASFRYTSDGSLYAGGYTSQPYGLSLSNGQNSSAVGPTRNEDQNGFLFKFDSNFNLTSSISIGGDANGDEDTVYSVVMDDWGRLVVMAEVDGDGTLNGTAFWVDAKYYTPYGYTTYLPASSNIALGLLNANLSGTPLTAPP